MTLNELIAKFGNNEIDKEILKRIDEIFGKENNAKFIDGEYYCFLMTDGDYSEEIWCDDEICLGREEVGNAFKTEEEAEQALEWLKIRKILLDHGGKQTFKPSQELVLKIFYDEEIDEFRPCYLNRPSIGSIIFESEEQAKEAISAVGEARLKKWAGIGSVEEKSND